MNFLLGYGPYAALANTFLQTSLVIANTVEYFLTYSLPRYISGSPKRRGPLHRQWNRPDLDPNRSLKASLASKLRKADGKCTEITRH
ncbi:hypothetical protein EVAR_94113_1 [Eumeta japonica]|uniref:Uncharacterized protein n=1 Tax=Eumeta variegata TaxID=151549 RepID=A0A4C1U6S6_EUMVA|nr:hypothetical protein EVAR_94113_1 [Eumeta japonica]